MASSTQCSVCYSGEDEVEIKEFYFESCDCKNVVCETCLEAWLTSSGGKCLICRKWASVETVDLILDRRIFGHLWNRMVSLLPEHRWLRMFAIVVVCGMISVTVFVSFISPLMGFLMFMWGWMQVVRVCAEQHPRRPSDIRYYWRYLLVGIMTASFAEAVAYISPGTGIMFHILVAESAAQMPTALQFLIPKKYKVLEKSIKKDE